MILFVLAFALWDFALVAHVGLAIGLYCIAPSLGFAWLAGWGASQAALAMLAHIDARRYSVKSGKAKV